MDATPIYLDHNATTPVAEVVLQAMLPYLREHFGNPSSNHVYGQRTAAAIDAARQQVAHLIGAQPRQVVFTSGGTEANNLALIGAALARPNRRHWISSTIEHPAVTEPLGELSRQGHRVDFAPVDSSGIVRLAEIGAALTLQTNVVSVMLANNETGVLQPISEVNPQPHGAWLHTDASQAVGKTPVQVDALGVDLLTIAGHKLYAPKGVGALYIRDGVELSRHTYGANHERGLSPGTENVASIVGLGAACALALRDLEQERRRQATLRDTLWHRLRDQIPGLHRNGDGAPCLPNTLSVCFPRVSGPELLAACPAIAASTSSACHSDRTQTSAVLAAMGVPEPLAQGAVRLSLGRSSTHEAIERAASALAEAWHTRTATQL